MSIIVNDNIQSNSPKSLDNKYMLNGVTPYVDVAEVNSTIPLPSRSKGLTVLIGNQEYWYKDGVSDIDLVIKSGGGSIYIDITRADLLNLISNNLLVNGTLYAITDFQDKDSSDTNSRVIITATSTNTISQTGFWKRLTQNKAYGAFTLNTGASGSVDQITVGGTPLMTASIPYTTSRINTANLTATNINANSVVSGYRAIVISGETVIDRPVIIIESITAGVNTSSLIVSVTTLTISNLVNLTMGVAQVEQTLDIAYDITSDRITSSYDAQYNILMKYTTQQITTLTYNPIINWRWGHSTFRNWTINGTGYRNFFDFPSTSGANTIEQNNNLIDGFFQNIVIRRTGTFTLSFSNNTNNLNFSNVQMLSNAQIHGNTSVILLTNSTFAGTNNSISGNEGSYINAVRTDATNARISITNSSCVGNLSINNNNIQGQINFTGVCSGVLAISSNFVDGNLSNSVSTYNSNISINNNNILGGSLTIPSGTINFTVRIIGNSVLNTNLATALMNITGVGSFTVQNCTFLRSILTYSVQVTSQGNVNLNSVICKNGVAFEGTVISLVILRTEISSVRLIGSNALVDTTIDINECTLEYVTGAFINNNPLIIQLVSSKIYNTTISSNAIITNSIINNTRINSSLGTNGVATITNCNISLGSSILLDDVNSTANLTMDDCELQETEIVCRGTITGVDYIYIKSSFFNTRINTFTNNNNILTFKIEDSYFENTDLDKLGINISPNNTDILRSRFLNCILRNLDSDTYTLHDSNFSNSNITSNGGGGEFNISNSIFQYADIDFSITPITPYIINNMTLIKDRGLYKSTFTFDGSSGAGLVNVPVLVIPDMIGQDVFKAIITKATISSITGLTAGVGANISLGDSNAPHTQYINTILVTSLNTNYQIKNEPIGIINEGVKYNVTALPTVANITSGSAEFAIEFLIAP